MTSLKVMMNLINMKERIAVSADFDAEERDFLLDAINEKIERAAAPVTVVYHIPKNYLGRIDAVWMVLSVDDGGEGIVVAPIGSLTLPLIAADRRRLDQIVPLAKQLAPALKKVLRLAKFTAREDIEVYRP